MAVRRFLVTVAATVLLLPLLGWASSAAPAGPPGATVTAARAPLITIGTGRWLFSPNHDGRRDTARRTFVLARQARVVVRVRQGDRLVRGPVRLGALKAGRHGWRWDGRGNEGRVVDDGIYRVVFTARRGDRTSQATASVRVDTTLERGTLVSTRSTVYPSATVVSDQVELAYLQPGWNEAWDLLLPYLHRTDLVITDARRHVVRRRSLEEVAMPVFDWFAVGNDGAPLPAGDYVARVTVEDEAGNRQVFRQPVTVSHRQLVEEVWTSTQAAADVDTFREFDGGCNGCATCRPVLSARFQGGLSFPPCDYESAATAGYFATDVPFAPAPVDAYRITATGGPTEAGAPDTGNLYGTPTTPGDTSTVSGWLPVALSRYPQLPEQRHPASWWFQTRNGSSYDVATFTVEYRHYVPVD
jgi:hypothetical protein